MENAMTLIEKTAIPDAGLPVAAFKAHLRLGSGFGSSDLQDEVLGSFLRAAMTAVEGRTGKILIERSFSLRLSDWSDPAAQVLPLAPVLSVTQVEQLEADASRHDLDPALYWLEGDAQTPRLRARGAVLPRVSAGGAVVVHFEAGFSPDWDGVPADLRQAVLLLAAHYYEYRHDTGLSNGCMPFGVSSLIERYKHIRLGAGAIR
jgi:uncharacterized phiE125 gp8 family phage protein